jgi:hypothetical protein
MRRHGAETGAIAPSVQFRLSASCRDSGFPKSKQVKLPNVRAFSPCEVFYVSFCPMSFQEILATVDSLKPSELVALDRKIRARLGKERFTVGELLEGVLSDESTAPIELPSDLSSNPKYMEGYGE